MAKTIGFVEDDEVLRLNYQDLLESDGYQVLSFSNYANAKDTLLEQQLDLVILDVGLGKDKEGGFKLCKVLREKFPALPIIFLTSHTELDFQSKGWRYGADDYVTKDTAIELVLLRIRTLLRRVQSFQQAGLDDKAMPDKTHLVVNDSQLTASWHGAKLDISLTQFWILKEIYEQGGKAADYEQLQKSANIVVEPNTIAAHIKLIRQAFCKIDPDFTFIATERGRGYRWLQS